MINFLLTKISVPSGISLRKIKEFFGEIYLSVKERQNGNKQFSFYLFNEILQFPLFCAEKIFKAISNINTITKNQFCDGLISLFFGKENDIICLLFSILDFDTDNIINIHDTKLFFIYLHSMKQDYKTEKILYTIIDNFFDNCVELDFNKFKSKCKINYDLILLIKFLVHLNRFFSFEQIQFFQERILLNRAIIINEKEEKQNIDKNKISNKLLNYISLNFTEEEKNKLKEEIKEKKIIEEDDDEIFKDLENFEKDIEITMDILDKEKIINHHSENVTRENKKEKNSSSSSSNSINDDFKKVNTIIKHNQFHKKLKKFFSNSKMEDIDDNHKRSFTFHTAKFTVKNLIKHSFILNNNNEFEFLSNDHITKIRLIIIKNIIFVFKLKEGFENFSYSNLIFLNSTFLEIKKNLSFNVKIIHSINLISTYQNYRHSIEFFTDSFEILNKFKDIFYKENVYKDINKEYLITNNEIGKGKFGLCQICTKINKDTKKNFCVKVINKFKNGINEEDYKIMMWEKSIFLFLKKFPNKNIVKSYDLFEDSQNLYLIHEYIKGFDLKEYQSKIKENNEEINPKMLINLSSQILNSINYLHSYGIIHRDIKHTNILINEKNIIKIIDFGLSRVLGKNEYTMNPYGSLCFKAPEIVLERPYNYKVDIWSLGITLYFLLYGHTPFNKVNSNILKDQICNETIKFENDFKFKLMANIINECLTKNFDLRPTSDDIIKKYFSNIQK